MPEKKFNKVLLVDDDKINNYINLRLIRRIGLSEEIIVTNNGQEAITYLKKCDKNELPTLILLDINMPVMDGFEFLEEYEKLKVNTVERPMIVVLTTSTNTNDIKKVESSPIAAGYINKPLTEENLLGFIRRNASVV
ncbi:response regulator rcp1 [Sporocytophaga myxococcoides]|uniref:Response regulator rcp1 n=1 Tax=Sporocytophaga myxococcoides TaxID=153721 RepID=A0A098LJC1_9BACT|nr:response regulator [Sporocytophaga myxococcoides]GAL86569.1 response regulator rcp1 [Sporocytophaga myxococcoides]